MRAAEAYAQQTPVGGRPAGVAVVATLSTGGDAAVWYALGLAEARRPGGSHPPGSESAVDSQTIEVLTGIPAAKRAHRPQVGTPDRRSGA